MATLLALRTRVNGELGITTDAETSPWTVAVRNQAIGDGYAELYRVGVWKPLTQSVATVADQWVYALTAIRRLERMELIDSESRIGEHPRGIVEDDGAGAWQLRLAGPLAAGYTIRVRGWGSYKSVFTSDADTDDLPAEHIRVPLLKAKAILWRAQVGKFVRYGSAQAVPPEMNATIEGLLGMVNSAEREFAEAARSLANLRPRSSQTRRI